MRILLFSQSVTSDCQSSFVYSTSFSVSLKVQIIEISLKDFFGKESELEEKLRNYNTFCLIGGNVFVLRKAMELSGFDKFIKDNLYNKKALFNYSKNILLLLNLKQYLC